MKKKVFIAYDPTRNYILPNGDLGSLGQGSAGNVSISTEELNRRLLRRDIRQLVWEIDKIRGGLLRVQALRDKQAAMDAATAEWKKAEAALFLGHPDLRPGDEIAPDGSIGARASDAPGIRKKRRRKTISIEELRRRLHLRDLMLLRSIICEIRFPLINRERAREAYRRDGYHKRVLREGPSRLETHYRGALRRLATRQTSELARFERAAHRMLDPIPCTPANQKLRKRLRRYFEKAFHVGSKSARVREILGCTIDEARQHLEKQFRPGMRWENHSFRGWHIDHKRPLASFNLADSEQQKAAFHYTNLQPLWAHENLTKNDKW